MTTRLIRGIGSLLTMEPRPEADEAAGRTLLGVVHDAALLIEEGRIAWAGPERDLPPELEDAERIDAEGRCVSPGLVDPHTHVVYAGERAGELALRAAGKSYRQIAEAGGGIVATVAATRAASEDDLVAAARPRLARMLARGVTTAEAKSGYGLDLETELRILRAIRRLSADGPVELVPTFLGAHAIPPELRGQPDAARRHVDTVIDEMLPRVADEQLAEFCDVFVETGFFDVALARTLMTAATAAGLKPKLHVDQLTAGGGAELAAEVGAVSADHLDHASDAGLDALAAAGTIAVLLPGAALFLGDAPPDARRFLSHGVRVALATDCNPGTCPTEDLPLMLTLGCTLLGLTLEHAWAAVTTEAAAAVGRPHLGRLVVGAPADVVIWSFADPAHLAWHFAAPHADVVIKAGATVFEADPADPQRCAMRAAA